MDTLPSDGLRPHTTDSLGLPVVPAIGSASSPIIIENEVLTNRLSRCSTDAIDSRGASSTADIEESCDTGHGFQSPSDTGGEVTFTSEKVCEEDWQFTDEEMVAGGDMATTPSAPGRMSQTSTGQRSLLSSTADMETHMRGLVNYMTVPKTAERFKGHVSAMNSICQLSKHRYGGFLLRDVADLTEVLQLCAEHLADHTEYVVAVTDLLELAKTPLICQKVTDLADFSDQLMDYIDAIGNFLCNQPGNTLIAEAAACAIGSLYKGDDWPPAQFEDEKNFRPVDVKTFQAAIECSNITEQLVQAFTAVLGEETDLSLIFLQVLQMILYSDNSYCRQLAVEADFPECLVLSLPDLFKRPQTRHSQLEIKLLLCILQDADIGGLAAEQLATRQSIRILGNVLATVIHQSRTEQQKVIRNDVMMILLLIACHKPDCPFVETNVLYEMILYATVPDRTAISRDPLVKGVEYSSHQLDFELKKMLISFLVQVHSIPGTSEDTFESVILSLLSFVRKEDAEDLKKLDWSIKQIRELQIVSLEALSAMVYHFHKLLWACQSSTRLLLMVDACSTRIFGEEEDDHHQVLQKKTLLQSESRHPKSAKREGFLLDESGSAPVDLFLDSVRVTSLSMRLLSQLITAAPNRGLVERELSDEGAIHQLLDFSEKLLQNLLQPFSTENKARGLGTTSRPQCEGGGNTQVGEEKTLLLCEIVEFLTMVCQDTHDKEIFGQKGVDLITEILQAFKHGHMGLSLQCDRQLLLATIHCTWEVIASCPLNEGRFLKKGGVYLLVDLLEFIPRPVQAALLGVLVDFCENQQTLQMLRIWKGKKFPLLSSLLVNLWKKEETLLKVARGEGGMIKDILHPLAGEKQLESRKLPPDERRRKDVSGFVTSSLPAVLEMTENLRVKIFALLGFLVGQEQLGELTEEDHVTLCNIQCYIDFKKAEIWQEIIDELDEQNIEPVEEDIEVLKDVVRISREKAEKAQKFQEVLLQARDAKMEAKEKETYDRILEHHEMTDQAMEDFSDLLARTSDRDTLKLASERKRTALEGERADLRPGVRYHRTSHSLNTTNFPMRHIKIESTPSVYASWSAVDKKSVLEKALETLHPPPDPRTLALPPVILPTPSTPAIPVTDEG